MIEIPIQVLKMKLENRRHATPIKAFNLINSSKTIPFNCRQYFFPFPTSKPIVQPSIPISLSSTSGKKKKTRKILLKRTHSFCRAWLHFLISFLFFRASIFWLPKNSFPSFPVIIFRFWPIFCRAWVLKAFSQLRTEKKSWESCLCSKRMLSSSVHIHTHTHPPSSKKEEEMREKQQLIVLLSNCKASH